MARETINGISVPVPGTGEPADFQGDLRRLATDLPASVGEMAETEGTPLRTSIQEFVVVNDLGTSDGQVKTILDTPTSQTAVKVAKSIAAQAQGMRVALMGDSRVAQCTQPWGYSSNGSTWVNDDRSWWHWAQIRMGQRFNYIHNSAVGGSTTADHVASQLNVIAATDASLVIHWGHLNDMGASSTPDPAVTIANLTTIYDTLRARGKTLVVTVDYLQPAQSNPAQIAACAKVNAFIRSYARANPGVILWDAAALLIDPDTSYVRASYTTDGTHPNKTGALILGKSLADTLAPLYPPASSLIATNNDPYNLLPNGLMTGGTISPTGWGASDGAGGAVPGTLTKRTRTDGGPGYLWEAALAATGSGTGKITLYSPNVSTTALVGHSVVPRVYFETGAWGGAMDWTNIKHLHVWAACTGTATAASFPIFAASDSSSVSAVAFPRSGTLRGVPITIPDGATNIRFWAEIATKDAGAGGGTFRIGQAEIHDTTACGY